MFRCPKCKASTRTRTSDPISNTTQRSYHQCNNILCGITFVTMTTVTHIVSDNTPDPAKMRDLPPIPMAAFRKSHRGDGQMEMQM
ncbi:ogr/Delta-like zinc finger family protein [Enterobacter ludwigii]|uniref:ogr/Delta-like zinc finger family protein n=1 Tax=Enterobacter ludwigii TaxID=299767 RepID=UPI003BEF00D6